MDDVKQGRPGEPGGEGEYGTQGGGRGGRGGSGGRGGDATSPRFNRALIVAGVIVLAVITTLLLLIQEQIQTTRARIAQEVHLAALVNEQQQELILEIRAQSRLNACLTLKLAKRHDVDVSGLDSPACTVFPNGAVIFPGEGATLLDPPTASQPTPDNGGEKPPKPPKGTESPSSVPSPPLTPQPSPPDNLPGPPGPTPTCIDLPPPLDDVCLPPP